MLVLELGWNHRKGAINLVRTQNFSEKLTFLTS